MCTIENEAASVAAESCNLYSARQRLTVRIFNLTMNPEHCESAAFKDAVYNVRTDSTT